MSVVKRVGVVSAAKIFAIFYGIIGILYGLIFGLIIGLSSIMGGNVLGLLFGIVLIVAFPIVAAIFGFIAGALMALFFNLALKVSGGLQVEIV